MVTTHRIVAFLVLVATFSSAALAGLAYYRRREPRGIVTHLLALTQTLLIAQVGLGLLLLSDHHRAPHRLHYLYGSLSLLAALSPWLYAPTERRSRLAWFAGATLVAGALAVRAYLTGT
jgi:heme A synthase